VSWDCFVLNIHTFPELSLANTAPDDTHDLSVAQLSQVKLLPRG